MSNELAICPSCGSAEVHRRKSHGDWICDACLHAWASVESPAEPVRAEPGPKGRLFLSYGRGDAGELAERLEQDLALLGYEVWRDTRKIRSGTEWDDAIEVGLRTSQLVVAVLTPHAVREESVCRDELAFARFACKLPIVPALAAHCEPPFVIFRLDYIDLTAWRDSVEQYKLGFKRLIDAIGAHLRGEPPRYRRWDTRLPQFDFGPYLYDRRKDFCGREWLFRRIDDWRAGGDRRRALLITGDPGIGKSAIVAQLVHMNPGGQVLAYHCCRADTPETLRPGRFIRGLAGMIATQLDAYAGQLDDPLVEAALGEARCETDPASAFEEGILNPLHRVPTPAGGVRYILIDALDEALATRDGSSIVTLLSPSRLDRLPGWLRVVATTRKDPDVLRRLSGLRAEEIRADEPNNLDDIERFLAHRLGLPGLRERLRVSGTSAGEAILHLRERSGGNFLWTVQALEGLEAGIHDFARLDALPPGLTVLYTEFFERHFPDDTAFAPARQVLEVVTAALEPLTPVTIAAATGLDPDYVLPPLLDRLTPYLPDRDGRRAVFHKSFSDWATEIAYPRPAGRFFVSTRRGHERLADSCWLEYRQDLRGMSPYAVRHLPAHLTAAGRWDELAAVLLDLSYLEAKAEAGLVFDLAIDFARSVDHMPKSHPGRRHLRLIELALRSDLYFIARHPTTLFQCLWNRCWWYDCAEAAAHYDPPPGGWPAEGSPWSRPGTGRLSALLESWRGEKEQRSPGFLWVRSRRPPPFPLGGAELVCLRVHWGRVHSAAFSPDGRRVVSASQDVQVWDVGSGAELVCPRVRGGLLMSAAFSPDGRRIVGASTDGTVWVWDAGSGAELACIRGTGRGVLVGAAFSPDGRRMVSWHAEGPAWVWDAETGAELVSLRGPSGSVRNAAFSADGRHIVNVSAGMTVRVCDALSGYEIARPSGDDDRFCCAAFSPDDRRIVGASYSGVVVWDAETNAVLGSLSEDLGEVHSVAFSPDGLRIVGGLGDGTVRVWDAESGAELARLRGHEGAVYCAAFSPDGRRIVSGSDDGSARVWDAESDAVLTPLRGHEREVDLVRFLPDGRRIASRSCKDGTVRVWDVKSGTCLDRIEAPDALQASAGRGKGTHWRAEARMPETVIEPAAGGPAVAWFPTVLHLIDIHQSGRIWTGSAMEHLYVIELDGQPDTEPSGKDNPRAHRRRR